MKTDKEFLDGIYQKANLYEKESVDTKRPLSWKMGGCIAAAILLMVCIPPFKSKSSWI